MSITIPGIVLLPFVIAPVCVAWFFLARWCMEHAEALYVARRERKEPGFTEAWSRTKQELGL